MIFKYENALNTCSHKQRLGVGIVHRLPRYKMHLHWKQRIKKYVIYILTTSISQMHDY